MYDVSYIFNFYTNLNKSENFYIKKLSMAEPNKKIVVK